MRKKVILIVLTVLVLIAVVFVLYLKLASTKVVNNQAEINAMNAKISETTLTFEESRSYIEANGNGDVILFFLDNEADSNYVKQTLLPSVKTNLNITSFSNAYYVDMSDVKTMSNARFSSQWGFTSYPAIVYAKVQDHQITIVSVLQENTTSSYSLSSTNTPFSVDSITNWFKLNNLWINHN